MATETVLCALALGIVYTDALMFGLPPAPSIHSVSAKSFGRKGKKEK